MATILTISSLVARGHVGNAATSFPLMRLGHEVRALPTVLLAHHPGHARNASRAVTPNLLAMGRDVLKSPVPHPVDGVLVGYLARPDQANAAAEIIKLTRGLKSGVPVLLDPISGDAGALYVDQEIITATRHTLLPLADIVTPNVTELAALTAPSQIGEAVRWRESDIIARALELGVRHVVITSTPPSEPGRAANLVVTGKTAHRIETPKVPAEVHGTGDLLAGLVLASLLEESDIVSATARAVAIIHDMLVETARLQSDELALSAAQQWVTQPATTAQVTWLG